MTAGEMIHRARDSMGMSIDDLAAASKLRASILTAMEADDFSHCGGDTYARGQLRAIAPMLGLAPEDLVAEYDRGTP